MCIRSVLVALGAGITVALLVGVALVALLPYEFSAIVSLPAGLLAGAVAALLIVGRYAHCGPTVRGLLHGTAGFGYATVLLLGVLYVDFAGYGSRLDLVTLLAVALLVAVSVSAWSRFRE